MSQSIVLSPLEIHSINKSLICLELQKEIREISQAGSLVGLGKPFDEDEGANQNTGSQGLATSTSRLKLVPRLFRSSSNPSKPIQSDELVSVVEQEKNKGLPLIKLIFQRFLASLPGLKDSPLWLNIGALVDDFNQRNFSTSRERKQLTKRAVVSIAYTEILTSLITPVLKVEEGAGQPSRATEEDLKLVSELPRLIWNYGSFIKLFESNDSMFQLTVIIMCFIFKKVEISHSFDAGDNPAKPELKLVNKIFNDIGHSKDKDKLFEFLRLHEVSPQEHQKKKLDEYLGFKDEYEEDWIKAGKDAHQAKQGYKSLVERLIYKDELDKLYGLIGQHENIESVIKMDPVYDNALKWSILWISYVFHFVFISGPYSEEICELIIRIHSLIPYALIRQGLKIVSPTLAIKSVVKLILGQPLGALSLLQRVLEIIIRQEIKTYNKQIELLQQVEEDVDQKLQIPNKADLFAAIEEYVYLSKEDKQKAWKIFDESQEDIILLILKRSNRFTDRQISAIKHIEEQYKKGDELTPPLILYQNLCLFLRLLCIKHDREQVIEIVLEPKNLLIKTVKSFLDILYPTINEIAVASALPDRLSQLEVFLSELVEILAKRKDEEITNSKFSELINKHKQFYWYFVHELVKHEDLCLPIKGWIRSSLDLLKDGVEKPSTSEDQSTKSLKLNLKEIISPHYLNEVREEARELSKYDRYEKMVDEIDYRLQFSSNFVPYSDKRNLRLQAIQIFSIKDKRGLGSLTDNNPQKKDEEISPSMFSWAWWIEESKLCGTGDAKINQISQEDLDLFKTGGVSYLNFHKLYLKKKTSKILKKTA
ncbi:hypothetical protein BY996DRAFT_4576011 [Phakopsora pachyrhizi]|uniref:Uncharacterized protein n=1 Tax=Phakopsora pachyrhizi TaxID=170000 RepID=A0AAV0BQ21_PHAPC|nr:hypothetical protein BY996DRAFT_4576011 [Phakopsora pachyrhizi]CAH7688747.1 hypothetical protein PPACK8108_LOCUS23753 [Phakopsora pachyrhizi]